MSSAVTGSPTRLASDVDTPPGRQPHGPATQILRPDDLHFDDLPPAARRTAFPQVDGYDISEVIGVGAMGIVLKARHRRLNRTVALKILGRDSLADPESHERFQLEAEAVARLQHPNIIQVFDVGAFADGTGDCPYLALEYVGGGSLYRHTLTPQNPRHAAGLVEKLARGVAAAHRVGVVHRDLKPANVLLTPDGEPKIADFGLAKQMEPGRDARGRFLTQLGAAVGTPEYMAPEQVDGKPVAPAIDVYALGVILYELLTARVPFKGETITETMLMVKYEEPVSPRRLQPNLPRDLETICLKCLTKAPAGRYATAEGLADDLARWLAGRPIHARPANRAERVGRWAKRNPTVAALAALAVLLAVAGVGGVGWNWREAVRHAERAEANAGRAEAKATEAEERRQAERWELYRGCLAFASADLRLNTLTTTRDTLRRAPEQYRGWEWHYYHSQLDLSQEVYRVEEVEVHGPVTVPGDRICLNLHGGVWVWDAVGRKHLGTVRDPGLWGVSPDNRGYLTRPDARTLAFRPFDGSSAEVRMTADADIIGYTFSADGRRLLVITGGWSQVYDTDTGRTVGVRHPNLTPEGGGPGLSAVSADGTLAAMNYTMSGDTEVWEVETGRVRFTLRKLENLHAFRFTRDGSRLLVNEAYPSNKVKLWDARTGQPAAVLDGHTNNVTDVVFSPDGTRIATASVDQTVRVWDAAAGRLVYTLRGHSSRVGAVAFSPDGRRLVSASDDRTVRLWDVTAGQELSVFRGHTGEVTGATFVGGDTVASVALDGTVRYWDTRSGPGSGVWSGHSGFVYTVAYHPDGKHVVSGAWDGTARVWDETGRVVRTFGMPKRPVAERRNEQVLEPEWVTGLAVHPAGKWVATVSWGDNVHLWDFESGEKLHTWERDQKSWKTGRVAFHPTADLLACGGGRAEVSVYDPRTKKTVVELGTMADAVSDVAFSPDGKWLVGAGDADKTVHVWEVATWTKVKTLTGAKDAFYSLAFSPDGRTLASGSVDGNVYLWGVGTWERQATLPHGVKVYGLAFTPDGGRLACGCADNTVRVWGTARHEQVAELRGHTDYVHSLTFSPDGRRLVTASGDLTLRTWDANPDPRPTD